MDIRILFEDTDILILDKPSGITVNKADTTKGERTVQDWVEDKWKVESGKLKVDEESDFYKRAGIVHRLDKETSGILVVAKTPTSFENLQKQFKERTVKKTYIALVHGIIEPEEGEIRVPVGRLPWNRMRFGVVAGGREAVTRYRVISNFKFPISNEQMSLLELYPETGRTHQIRVHLKHIGHPILGDSLYAGRKTARNDRKILPRVFLHASKIFLFHPKTLGRVEFESKLPGEFVELLSLISKAS